MTPARIFLLLNIFAVLALSFVIAFANLDSMSPNWTGPYYSGSANLSLGGDFNVCESDVLEYNRLDNRNKEKVFQFNQCQEPVHYNHNPVGYCYLLYISRSLLGSFGDMYAAIFFQILFYFFLSYLMFRYMNISDTFKIILFILFWLNPFVLRFTVFNFYYFWFIVPIFLSLLYLTKSKIPYYIDFTIFTFSALIFSFRPTFVLIIALLLILSYKQWGLKNTLLKSTILFLVLIISFRPAEKNFYHTALVGIGAYPNSMNLKLSDDDAYAIYKKETGEKLNASYGGNYYQLAVIQKYKEISRKYFLVYIKDNPEEFVRNLFLNTGLAFSSGYITSLPYYIKVGFSLLGWMILALLVYRKLYLLAFIIILNSATIVLYYPPIPAYILGNYLLLAFGAIKVMEAWILKTSPLIVRLIPRK